MVAHSYTSFVSQASLKDDKNHLFSIGWNELKIFFYIFSCNPLSHLATLFATKASYLDVYGQGYSCVGPVRAKSDWSKGVARWVCPCSSETPFGHGWGSWGSDLEQEGDLNNLAVLHDKEELFSSFICRLGQQQ